MKVKMLLIGAVLVTSIVQSQNIRVPGSASPNEISAAVPGLRAIHAFAIESDGVAAPLADKLVSTYSKGRDAATFYGGNGGQNGNVSQAKFFSGPCTPVGVPYNENFESVTAPTLPACVVVEDRNGSQTWENSTLFPHSGTNSMAYTYSSTGPADDWFFTAPLDLTGSVSYRLSFWYAIADENFPEGLEVRFGGPDTADAITGTILFSDSSLMNMAYRKATVDFTPSGSGTFYIAFHAISAQDEFVLYVDDISVDVTPACASPTNVKVNATGSNRASVSFLPVGSGSDYIVEYGPVGFTPGTGATAGPGGTVVTTSAGSPVAIMGLPAADTTFDFYVRKICAGPSYSDNSAGTRFVRNDDAAGALSLVVNAGCTGAVYSNLDATKAPGEKYPSCSGSAIKPVWFKFIAPASGAVRISTDSIEGTFVDTKLGLFAVSDSSNYNTFSIIACDEDGGHLQQGYRSVLYATGLTPGATYFVGVDKYGTSTVGSYSGTYCIAVDELQASMLAGSTNSCSSGTYQVPAGSNSDYTGWVPLLDQFSHLIALVRNPSGDAVENYNVSMNLNSAAVRQDAVSGERYLDRSFFISNGSAVNAQVRLFFLESERAALNSVDPVAKLGNLQVTLQAGTSCQPDFVAANGTNSELIPASVTDSGRVNGADWIGVTTTGLSNFFIHSTKLQVVTNVFLQGAYDSVTLFRHRNVTTTWRNVLINNATSQPYNTTAFGNYNGGESVPSSFFTSDNTNARDVVDWILLELKDGSNTLVGRRAALVREDGKVIDTNGDSAIVFNGVKAGNYYLTIRHRNHLGISTQNLIGMLTKGLGTMTPATPTFDFPAANDATIFGTAAAFKVKNGKVIMIGGNANSNGNVRYQNVSNDPAAILVALNNVTSASLTNAYNSADVNMDGVVRYQNLNNDPAWLLLNVLGNVTTGIINEQKR